MKLQNFKLSEDTASLAVLENDQWILLSKLVEQFPEDDSEEIKIIKKGASDLVYFLDNVDSIKEKLASMISQADLDKAVASDDLEILAPYQPSSYRSFMLSPQHVIDSGRGMAKYCLPDMYEKIKEYEDKTGEVAPDLLPKDDYKANPIYYKGNHLSFYSEADDIVYPDYATVMDYELEFGYIITKQIRNASVEEAWDSIGGFVIFNDFSARNVQPAEMMGSGFGPAKSKDFANGMSNIVVTPDEVLPYLEDLKTRVFINDELVAQGQANGFLHTFGDAIAYASKGETIFPGEFMVSGTIPGCSGLESDALLSRGDSIRLEIDRIGSMTSKIR